MINKTIMAIALMLLLIGCAAGYPKLNRYVTDDAGILSSVEEQQLTMLIERVEAATGYEIAVLTVASTEGEDRMNFASRTGETSGIGKADLDNGVVVMWSLGNEQGGAIATGRGAESVLTDAQISRIGRASRSYFDNKEYYSGFEFIVKEIGKLVDAESFGTETEGDAAQLDYEFQPWHAIAFVLLIIYFSIFGWDGLFILYLFSGRGGGSSGGRRGGGGSFGGGGSGW